MTPEDLKALDVRTRDGVKFGKELRKEFLFADEYRNLNHGSFGTFPLAIRQTLRSFQDQVEARPDTFIRYTYPKLLDESRAAMSKLLNVPTPTLVFVPNATTGVNTILRNISYAPGDHIICFSAIYGACEKTIAYVCETNPAEAAKINFTFPIEDDEIITAFENKVKEIEGRGEKVKVAVFDAVVSMPGVRFPYERMVEKCRELGVLSCVDGAHGVGHIDLDLGALDPDFLVSNCHKWLYVPRGCAILHVPLRNQHLIRSTLPTSHGFIPAPKAGEGKIANPLPPSGVAKSAFEANFEYVGTVDNAPYLCIPAALKWREEKLGGEKTIRDYNFALSKLGTKRVAEMLGTEVLENKAGTLTDCCMANVRLPLDRGMLEEQGVRAGIEREDVGNKVIIWVSRTINNEFSTFMAAQFNAGQWWIRLSAQVYLDMDDYEWAGNVLKKVSDRVKSGEWTEQKSLL